MTHPSARAWMIYELLRARILTRKQAALLLQRPESLSTRISRAGGGPRIP